MGSFHGSGLSRGPKAAGSGIGGVTGKHAYGRYHPYAHPGREDNIAVTKVSYNRKRRNERLRIPRGRTNAHLSKGRRLRPSGLRRLDDHDDHAACRHVPRLSAGGRLSICSDARMTNSVSWPSCLPIGSFYSTAPRSSGRNSRANATGWTSNEPGR
jgi:hypothetical protein